VGELFGQNQLNEWLWYLYEFYRYDHTCDRNTFTCHVLNVRRPCLWWFHLHSGGVQHFNGIKQLGNRCATLGGKKDVLAPSVVWYEKYTIQSVFHCCFFCLFVFYTYVCKFVFMDIRSIFMVLETTCVLPLGNDHQADTREDWDSTNTPTLHGTRQKYNHPFCLILENKAS